MRKVVLSKLLSLDGVAEDPNKFFFDWDEVVDDNGAALIATQDEVAKPGAESRVGRSPR